MPPTYLLTWNPAKWPWESQATDARRVAEGELLEFRWSVGVTRSMPIGSSVYLLRQGSEPRGLIASGVTTGEVFEAPHWAGESGESDAPGSARYVNVRVDTLRVTPLVSRLELNRPPFVTSVWDTQSSGVTIPEPIADALRRLWDERKNDARYAGGSLVMEAPPFDSSAALTPDALARWRAHVEAAQFSFTAQWSAKKQVRAASQPQLARLIREFLDGRIDVTVLKTTFQKQATGEWGGLGLRNRSFGMLFNQLVKYAVDRVALTAALQAVMAVPQTDEAARSALRAFVSYVEEQVRLQSLKGTQLPVASVPFLISVLWNAQAPEVWPTYFQSSRDLLVEEGLIPRALPPSDSYTMFVPPFRALSQALGLSFWDLEHVCSALREPNRYEVKPTTAPQSRVWLIGAGDQVAEFDRFYRDGLVAIGWPKLGDLTEYETQDAIRDALRKHADGSSRSHKNDTKCCWDFAHEMEPGDQLLFKDGRHRLIGVGEVASDYEFDATQAAYPHVRKVRWVARGSWEVSDVSLISKTLTEVTAYPEFVALLNRAVGGSVTVAPASEPDEPYTLSQAAADLFLPDRRIEELRALLAGRRNVVLQGPPGTGKTYLARRLAYLLMGEKDDARIRSVQFHQSFSYEDFVQGYRPTAQGGFALRKGLFLDFCTRALQEQDEPHVLIIDEINRGNLSKIFGELMQLIEPDKRSQEWAVRLAYESDDAAGFHVPPNLHIIGTMNTADRSLAMVDYAMRRRFGFVDVEPAFNHPGFAATLERHGISNATIDRVIHRMAALNATIAGHADLGDGFRIGHSYFCQPMLAESEADWYARIVKTELAPLLREYWFDAPDTAATHIASVLA